MNAPINPSQLTKDLGGKWHRSYGVAPCPVCQPQRRKDQNALTIKCEGEMLLMHCKKAGCDFRDILAGAGIATGKPEIDHAAMRQIEHDRNVQAAKASSRARSMWDYAGPISGTYGETYLRSRGITCTLPPSLRWLPDAYHGPSGTYGAAIVGDVTTGGVHRTFFDKLGNRLGKSAKMMLGPCGGGYVALSDAQGPLVVSEGIETGLSLLSGLLEGPHAVVAALSTSGIKGLILPEKSHDLIIATDGDPAGEDAGNVLGRRAHFLGWNVSLLPAPSGKDWNDVLMAGEVAA